MINYTITQVWLLWALIFVIFEMGTPGLFFSLSLAFGALSAAAGAWNDIAVLSQWLVFFGGTVFSLIGLNAWVAVNVLKDQEVTNVHALIGKKGVVIKNATEYHAAQIKVGGECWSALSQDGQFLAYGDNVTIINVTGVKLIVKINQ
ncbi:NfeD family protein [Candidatus Babeliales bacterium]|nr:NfeD family protein [Candidatus Babeliales bacterium]